MLIGISLQVDGDVVHGNKTSVGDISNALGVVVGDHNTVDIHLDGWPPTFQEQLDRIEKLLSVSSWQTSGLGKWIDGLYTPDPEYRYNCIESLASLQTMGAHVALQGALANHHRDVRLYAIFTLAYVYQEPLAIPKLENIWKYAEDLVAQQTNETLYRLFDKYNLSSLLGYVPASDLARLLTLMCLGLYIDFDNSEIVVMAFEHPWAMIRLEAVESFGRRDRYRDIVTKLALHDDNNRVREAADMIIRNA